MIKIKNPQKELVNYHNIIWPLSKKTKAHSIYRD